MRFLTIVVVLLVLDVVLVAVMMRRLRHDPGVWHVDPLTAPKPSTPNSHRVAPSDASAEADDVAPVFDVPAAELGAAFDRVARGAGRVEVVDGSAADGFVTYVQRSAVFGFPDYISVRFIDVGPTQSTLAMFSRSRIGKSDLGVNKKRVDAWVAQLAQP